MTNVESADKLNECNDGKRSSEVLLKTLEELEKVKQENEMIKYLLCKAKGMLSVYVISGNQSTYSKEEVHNLLNDIDNIGAKR